MNIDRMLGSLHHQRAVVVRAMDALTELHAFSPPQQQPTRRRWKQTRAVRKTAPKRPLHK